MHRSWHFGGGVNRQRDPEGSPTRHIVVDEVGHREESASGVQEVNVQECHQRYPQLARGEAGKGDGHARCLERGEIHHVLEVLQPLLPACTLTMQSTLARRRCACVHGWKSAFLLRNGQVACSEAWQVNFVIQGLQEPESQACWTPAAFKILLCGLGAGRRTKNEASNATSTV